MMTGVPGVGRTRRAPTCRFSRATRVIQADIEQDRRDRATSSLRFVYASPLHQSFLKTAFSGRIARTRCTDSPPLVSTARRVRISMPAWTMAARTAREADRLHHPTMIPPALPLYNACCREWRSVV